MFSASIISSRYDMNYSQLAWKNRYIGEISVVKCFLDDGSKHEVGTETLSHCSCLESSDTSYAMHETKPSG